MTPARAAAISTELEEILLPKIESDFGVAFRLSGLSEQEEEFLSDALLGFILCMIGIYLTLAWIFSSWTRPIVVLAIVPFGLVGAIYGHVAWEVPLSMFSVVGLIGMTGIIINDSIVLVTTVDEYAEERGLIPAIIDGTADRLRPVLLTTMTTVLGLTPLLFEGSVDAQFLKPTVITLVYGLGFGMILVLLVVPALLAMQLDVRRQMKGLTRALRAPGRDRGAWRDCGRYGGSAGCAVCRNLWGGGSDGCFARSNPVVDAGLWRIVGADCRAVAVPDRGGGAVSSGLRRRGDPAAPARLASGAAFDIDRTGRAQNSDPHVRPVKRKRLRIRRHHIDRRRQRFA